MAAADVVVSKPGYGIVSECAANGAALLYTSRGPFAEYDVMLAEMPRMLRCRYLAQEDLVAGHWREAIEALLAQPLPAERPRVDGAAVAAEMIFGQTPYVVSGFRPDRVGQLKVGTNRLRCPPEGGHYVRNEGALMISRRRLVSLAAAMTGLPVMRMSAQSGRGVTTRLPAVDRAAGLDEGSRHADHDRRTAGPHRTGPPPDGRPQARCHHADRRQLAALLHRRPLGHERTVVCRRAPGQGRSLLRVSGLRK